MEPVLIISESFRCRCCGGPWIATTPITPRSIFCSKKCRKSHHERLRSRDKGATLRSSEHQQPTKHSKANCAICLYRVGFGYTSIGKRLKSPKNICRRWIILSGNETHGRNSQQNRSKRLHSPLTLRRKRKPDAELIILQFYREELRAAERPDLLWSKSRFYFKKPRTDKDREKENYRIKNDPRFRAIFYARKRIRNFLKQRGWNKNSSTSKAIGCSPQFLRDYIQQRFKPGMAWNNHGKIWHIDHVKPLASAKSASEVMKLAHYTNLQPLFVSENMAKGDKWIKQTDLALG